MAYDAKIVLDSVSTAGDRLTTMEVTFPRIVLAEFNTHRAFSRNSASSRAIPFKKQIDKIIADPFVPTYWGANQSGMQAEKEVDYESRLIAVREWLAARDDAVAAAATLHDLNIHKQTVNRLLEPFMWQTVIVTATEWSNFFALRANPQAQPEIREIAEWMQRLHQESEPTELQSGEWHMPYLQSDERPLVDDDPERMQQVSAARCARVSYLTQDGKRDLEEDVKLYARLKNGGHLSPLEHVATPAWHVATTPWEPRVSGWDDGVIGKRSEQHGNLRGWKQLRKFVPNESDFSRVEKE